jgi:predicted ATP-grasp superfamily ATP-dependent carboligase
MTDRPAVLLLKLVSDPMQHGGLGVTRSLGRLGVPVHVAYRDRHSPASRSRYVAGRHHLAGADEAVLLRQLCALAQRLGSMPILMPLDDVAATFANRHAARLGAGFRFPEQPQGLAVRLAHKGELHRLCEAAGVPVPDARFPRSRSEFLEMADELGYPVVVKSMDPALLRARPGAASVAIAHDRRGAAAIYDASEIPEAPNLMLQRFIPGGARSVWMFNGYVARDGSCTFAVTGQKIRQWPPATGATSLGVAAINSTVADHARRFLEAVGYRGIVDMGFRHDARDGSYRLLDVNPRIGSSFRLFVDRAGNDVARALYADFSGDALSSVEVDGARRWIVENQDLATVVRLLRTGHLAPSAWLGSLRGIREAAWWARDDPRPWAAMVTGTAVGSGGRLIRDRLRRRRP